MQVLLFPAMKPEDNRPIIAGHKAQVRALHTVCPRGNPSLLKQGTLTVSQGMAEACIAVRA